MAPKNMNQQDSNRKYNPDNMPPKGDDQKKKPRFNIYWIYGIIFLSIVGWNLFRNVSSAGIEMNQQYVTELLKAGDVEQDAKKDPDKTGLVVVRNKKIVRIFLSKDSVLKKAAFYKTFLKTPEYDNLIKADAPQLYFSIAKDETFAKQLDDFYTANPELKKILPAYTEEGEIFGQIISTLLPILLIGLLFVMMMRKVGGPGGGGGPGGIFSIGKIGRASCRERVYVLV